MPGAVEFQNLPSQADANELAKDIREATGETALVSIDTAANNWKIWVGTVKSTTIDADELKARLGVANRILAIQEEEIKPAAN